VFRPPGGAVAQLDIDGAVVGKRGQVPPRRGRAEPQGHAALVRFHALGAQERLQVGVLEQFRLVAGKLQRTATVLLTAGPVPAAVMAWTERV
jgi:hypothetical protein